MDTLKLFETMEYGPAPESAAAANAWLDGHKRSFQHFIGNAWTAPSAKTTIDVHNPATGDKIASVADANSQDIDRVVNTARKAQKKWDYQSSHES